MYLPMLLYSIRFGNQCISHSLTSQPSTGPAMLKIEPPVTPSTSRSSPLDARADPTLHRGEIHFPEINSTAVTNSSPKGRPLMRNVLWCSCFTGCAPHATASAQRSSDSPAMLSIANQDAVAVGQQEAWQRQVCAEDADGADATRRR